MNLRRQYNRQIHEDTPISSLLNEVNDYAIYTFFLGKEVEFKELINSPLRVDPRPTFNIYPAKEPRWPDQIMFKDFNGETGNVFRFVQLFALYHFNATLDTLPAICDYIRQVMNLREGAPKYEMKMPEYSVESTHYSIKSMLFKKNHIEFWDDLGVKADMLNFYDTVAVQYLFNEHNEIIKNFGHTTTFAYLIADRFKLYQPYEENFKKFFNTCPMDYVQGYLQCQNKFDLLIVTKAMKDILVIQSHTPEWIDIIAPHGEGYIISEKWLYWMLQYRRILILFDPDYAGVRGTNRLRKALKTSRFNQGTQVDYAFISTKRTSRNEKGKWEVPIKDSADYRLIYGQHRTEEKLNKLIYG